MLSRGQRLAYLAKQHNMAKRHVSGSYVEQWIIDCEKSDYGKEVSSVLCSIVLKFLNIHYHLAVLDTHPCFYHIISKVI